MRKEARQKQVKLRKNFFPTLLITILLWGFLGGLIYFVDPSSPGAVSTFFILLFLSLLFTFSILWADSLLGTAYSLGFTLFLILRYFGIGNVVNLLLLLGVLAAFTIVYFRKT
jgi:hypothetical protein